MDELLSTLDLEPLEVNLFLGRSPQVGWQRVFGGQVIAQALVAAGRTVETGRYVHSLHAYFVRPGDPAVPILYDVERIRDGASFTTRRVKAVQHDKPIFFMTASFHVDEPGFDHQLPMPDVPPPEDLLLESGIRERFLAQAPKNIRDYWERPRPVELRPVELTHYLSPEKLLPTQNVWVRTTGPVPYDRTIQAAVLG